MASDPGDQTQTCPYCLTDLQLGDHSHEDEVDVREIQATVEAVARGEGPLPH